MKAATGLTVRTASENAALSKAALTPAAAAATTIIGKLFKGTGYTGDYWEVTETINAAGCSDGSAYQIQDFGASNGSYNNAVRSYESYSGCTTQLWDDANFHGSTITGTNRTSLGAMDKKANSAKWTP